MISKPIDKITFADVVEFCNHQMPENERLEYKQEFSKKPGLKIAKEVCAFANTQGGTIIWGVVEQGNRKPKPGPKGMDLGGNPRQTVLNACTYEMSPSVVPELSEYLRDPKDASKGFLVARVGASQDVPHTVEGRKGIYIRVADQSEPVRATDDQIAVLLARRDRARDVQQERRDRGIERLETGFGKDSRLGRVSLSIGPAVATEPLFELTELREQAPSFSVQSYWHSATIPIRSSYEMLAAQDGVFAIELEQMRTGRTGGLLDVYGNVLLVTNLLIPLDPLASHFYDEPTQIEKSPRDEMGKYLGIDGSWLIERVFALLGIAGKVYERSGFFGVLTLGLRAQGVRHVPIALTYLQRQSLPLGWCHLDDSISINCSLTTDVLSQLDDPTIREFARQILWAFGCMDEEHLSVVLDLAEKAHSGFIKCGSPPN